MTKMPKMAEMPTRKINQAQKIQKRQQNVKKYAKCPKKYCYCVHATDRVTYYLLTVATIARNCITDYITDLGSNAACAS
jgi:hypothetical protein